MKTDCGKVIAANRKRLGLTQAELGAKLNVTAQAVSKWENGNAEPDLATLQRLIALFGISAEELFGDKRTEAKPDSSHPSAEGKAAAECAPQAGSVIIGYCDSCKKPIAQNEKYHVYPATRGKAQRIVCYACYEREETARKRNLYYQERKQFRRSIVVASIVAALVLLIGVIAAIVTKDPIYLVSIAVAAALFMFVAQCFWTSYALELLLFFCRSFRLPGVIFTLDLDGILWFITAKLLFGALTALLSVLLFGIGLCISMAVGVVTFPFCFPSELGKLRDLKQAIQKT